MNYSPGLTLFRGVFNIIRRKMELDAYSIYQGVIKNYLSRLGTYLQY